MSGAVTGGSGREQLPALTSLRFFAALWVLGHHAMPRVEGWTSWNAFWGAGWLGVTFFFVLSGFILTYTYGAVGRPLAARPFWGARVARIVPVYFAAMLFAVPQFVHTVTRPEAGQSLPAAADVAGAAVTSVLMLQAWFADYVCLWNCPSWSLSAEFFFYALFPWLVPFAMTRIGRASLFVATLVSVGTIAAGSYGFSVSPVAVAAGGATLNPLARLPEFVAGIWLCGAFLARRGPTMVRSLARRRWAWVGIAAASLGLAGLAVGGRQAFGPALHLWSLPLFAVVVYSAASLVPARDGVLGTPALVLLGGASYTLYMTHGPLHGYVLAAANRLAPGAPAAAVFVVYLVAAVALAVAGYVVLERPARVWVRQRLAPGTATR